MFSRKKKKENNLFAHNVLGEILIDSFPHTVNSFDITLFGKKYSIYLYINSPNYIMTHQFTADQEAAITFFDSNIALISERLERQLKAFFRIDDSNVYNEKLSLENITISAQGELGAFFNSDFDDEELKNIDSNFDFTNSFGIVIYPNERLLYNEEECYRFEA